VADGFVTPLNKVALFEAGVQATLHGGAPDFAGTVFKHARTGKVGLKRFQAIGRQFIFCVNSVSNA
jgi:hypothetical protein